MNFKFLPFVIGMALASTAANADNLSGDHISLGKPVNAGHDMMRMTMDYGTYSDYNNFISAHNSMLGAYKIVFNVDENGYVSSKGFDVTGGTATDTPKCPHLSCVADPGNNRGFLIKTSGYNMTPDLKFLAGSFTFNGGNMVVNGKITCKDELEVIGLTASTIKAEDINVNMNNAADYVFDENYNLKSLSEVESYVNEHKHLPGIPSAADMAENGMNVSTMSNLLLEKVEELTLHMIRLEKENAALKAEVKSLKK